MGNWLLQRLQNPIMKAYRTFPFPQSPPTEYSQQEKHQAGLINICVSEFWIVHFIPPPSIPSDMISTLVCFHHDVYNWSKKDYEVRHFPVIREITPTLNYLFSPICSRAHNSSHRWKDPDFIFNLLGNQWINENISLVEITVSGNWESTFLEKEVRLMTSTNSHPTHSLTNPYILLIP